MTITEIDGRIKTLKEEIRDNGFADEFRLKLLADMERDRGNEAEADALIQGLTILNALEDVKEVLQEAKRVYEERKAWKEFQEVSLRNKCPHPISKYYPDPSGNNDSYTECLCCGKEL